MLKENLWRCLKLCNHIVQIRKDAGHKALHKPEADQFWLGIEIELKGDTMIRQKIFSALLACSLTLGANVNAQDPYRDVCAKEIENRVDKCSSGKEYVWHYTFSGPQDGGRISRSWGYKTREEAQRALDSNKRLCQTVDRYWEKTDCQTTYGPIFCAGCGMQNRNPRRLSIEETEILAAGVRQLDRWRNEISTAFRNIKSAQEIGQASPSAGIGNTLREYVGELKAARERALQVEKLMNSVARGGAGVLNKLNDAVQELDRMTGRVEAGQEKLSARLAEIKMKPTAERLSPTSLTGKWSSHTFDFHGTRLQQTINLEDNRLKVTIQAVNPVPNGYNLRTYTVSLNDLFLERSTLAQVGPSLWAVTILANDRKVTDISSSSNDSIEESVSRIKLLFSTEDYARAAASALKSLSSK